MKKLLLLFIALALAVMFSMTGCVDPDEAMPHYNTPFAAK
jgi:hypothetical protein